MMNNEIDSSQYQQLLEEMLKRLHREINEITHSDHPGSDIHVVDEYIHALNSFYYQSFNEYYFPQFITIINNDISDKLRLRRQEDRLQQDIITSMQRYVKLYNQVKTIANLLTKSRHEINHKLIIATRYQDISNADFLLAVKQLHDNLTLFRSFTLDLLQLTEDKLFMEALHKVPDFISLVQLVQKMDFSNQKDLKTVNSLLSHLTFLCSLLQDNSRELWGKKENGDHLKESFSFSIDDFTKKAPVSINRFYDKYIRNQLTVYMHLLDPSTKSAAKTNYNLAKDCQDWLEAMKIILDRCIYYSINNNIMLPYLTTVISLPAEYASLLNNWVTNCLEEVKILYEEFSNASEPDFSYFYQQTTVIINNHSDKLGSSDWRGSSPDISPLPYWQKRINMELHSLTYLMDFFKEKNLHARQLIDQYLEVVNLLDTYLNLLADIRSDLERLLAPRNISRAWKDIYVRIDRIPLEKGKVFPSEYSYLLESSLVRKTSAESSPNTVLYEEGDLFIIKVDDQTVVELPKIILAE